MDFNTFKRCGYWGDKYVSERLIKKYFKQIQVTNIAEKSRLTVIAIAFRR
jgi:hypothetical protein